MRELLPGDKSKILAVSRAGQSLPISEKQILETRDLIYLSADTEEIEAIRHRLGFQQERLA
jgi:uncharacterized transporter YbjL